MFVVNRKYYLIVYWGKFYEAKFIGTRPYAENVLSDHISTVTEYIFRTKQGDLFIRSDYRKSGSDDNYIATDFNEIKLEMAKRIYRGKPVGRCPIEKDKLLKWAMYHHPDKLL